MLSSKQLWWECIDADLWENKKSRMQQSDTDISQPRYLLRFIRNCHTHGTSSIADQIFMDQPYFLVEFPNLVVDLWEVCHNSPTLSIHPLLRPILFPVYTPTLSFPLFEPGWL